MEKIQDPAVLAKSLHSNGLISELMMKTVQDNNNLCTKEAKNQALIRAVEAQSLLDDSAIKVFLDVLQKDEPHLDDIVKRMKEVELGESAAGDYRRPWSVVWRLLCDGSEGNN